MKFREGWATAAIAVGAFALLTLWSYPLIHPLAWGDLSIAAGLRAPADAFSGLYRGLMAAMFAFLPANVVMALVPWLGRVAVALATAALYAVLRDALPSVMRVDPHLERVLRGVGRGIAAMSAMLFLCIDPIWRAGQAFSSVTLVVVLSISATWFYFSFLLRRRVASLYLAFILLGALSAENAIGYLLTLGAAFYLGYVVYSGKKLGVVTDELIWNVTAKRLSYVWMFFYALSSAAGVWVFLSRGGMAATGCEGLFDFVLLYMRGGWAALTASAGLDGWFFGIGACILPFAVAVGMLRKAWKDDDFLPYLVGIVFTLVAITSLSQIAAVNPFWSGISARQTDLVPSETLRAFFLVFSLAAFALAANVFGVDVSCRNYRSIARWRFPDSVAEEAPEKFAADLGKGRRRRKRIFWTVLLALPLVAIPGRYQGGERAMMGALRECAEETLRECEGRGTIFTDGSLDLCLELMALARGRAPLNALSMVSPNTTHARTVRYRAVENDEDRDLLEHDSSAALRTWIETDSPRLARCAVQLGFEFWRRIKKDPPTYSGLCALPGAKADDAVVTNGYAAADALAASVLAISERYDTSAGADREVKRLFPFVLWRLSRISRMRAMADAKARLYTQSMRETETADKLDAANRDLAVLNTRNRWLDMQNGGALTPREGLVIGLSRADFRLAGRFAGPVLKADPDDPRANFAMGMKSYLEEAYVQAEQYFLRCLKRNPGEPAVLNNLANAQVKIGKYDEAELHARLAIEKIPGSAEARKTLSRIKELARKAR